MKSLTPYFIAFVLLIIGAWILGTRDPIPSAVVQARVETSAGPVTMNVINQGMVLFLKWAGAASLAGILGAVFVEARKFYRHYWFSRNTGRDIHMRPGNYQPRQSIPKLTREDIMLMMLGQKGSARLPRTYMPSDLPPLRNSRQEESDEIDLSDF